MSDSPQGRRVLVAVVTGAIGERIQAWRRKHDPEQAVRLPPHTTLCYWAPVVELGPLEAQIRHAFDRPVAVRLGRVHEFDNREHTFYVEVGETEALDAARERLYDGTILDLPRDGNWTWHVTCVRDSRGRDLDALRRAAEGLVIDDIWTIDTVAYLELRDHRYETLAEWRVA